MMDYSELVKDLRYCADPDTGCSLCKYFGENCEQNVIAKAADAIEELGRMLCNWCGVCPEERRDLWNCEIAFPNAQVQEVWIEPPKEETE